MRGTSGEPAVGSEIASSPWFLAARNGPWLGVIDSGPHNSNTAALGDMAAPVRDASGRVVGVVARHLSWRRAPDHPERLTDESDPRVAAQAYVLDRDGIVLVGPDGTAQPALERNSGRCGDLRRFAPSMRRNSSACRMGGACWSRASC